MHDTLSGVESGVINALSQNINDDVQIKILVKDQDDEGTNKFKEIYSYSIDKSNFKNKALEN